MFSPRSHWSKQTQGYTGTSSPNKYSSPGSPEKPTVAIGGGWRYDKAEAARLAREEALREDTKGRTKPTEQGEKRAMDAKSPAGAFDTRAQSPKKEKAGAKKKQPASGQSNGDESGRPRRRRSSTPPPKSFNDQKWCEKTQGFTGRYNWSLGK